MKLYAYQSFVNNIQTSIPTLKGEGNIGQNKPQNDYLSMIGERNNNRQPRMRMGAGGDKNSKPVQDSEPKDQNIMSGLDDLADLN